jgi:GNAT superfamily N-acetyltransferase
MHGIDIEVLDHRVRRTAESIHAIQMVAYQQEASLLGVTDFPPLRRTVNEIENSAERFFGARHELVLAGVIAIAGGESASEWNISSLVVLPQFQRRGVGRALLGAVISRFLDRIFTVSTGAINQPALELYAKMGFVESRQYLSGCGMISMVGLHRPITSPEMPS